MATSLLPRKKELRFEESPEEINSNGVAAHAASHGDHEAMSQPEENGVPPRVAEEKREQLVQVFKLLADDTRLRILFFLMNQPELNVRELCGLLRQSQPAVSHHLALLRVAGLIACRRDGKHNFYGLVPKQFADLQRMFSLLSLAEPTHA